ARDIRGQPDDREKVPGSYDKIPMRWGGELRALSRQATELASRVRAPALILQGALDRTLSPWGARRLQGMLSSPRVELRMLPRSGHVLQLDVESAEVCSSIVSFFQGVA